MDEFTIERFRLNKIRLTQLHEGLNYSILFDESQLDDIIEKLNKVKNEVEDEQDCGSVMLGILNKEIE